MKTLQELLDLRFGDIGAVPETLAGNEAIRRLAGRGVVRRFKPKPLPAAVLDTLAAVALSSPSKSDLQQRDILIVEDAAIRARINALLKYRVARTFSSSSVTTGASGRGTRGRVIPSPTTISTPSSTRRSMRPSRSKPSSRRQRRRASVAARSA